MSIATILSNNVRRPGDPVVTSSGPSSLTHADRTARALGWFSIGLGLSELLFARRYTRMLGVESKEWLVRTSGLREIGEGMLTLSASKAAGLWSRVAGDALDIAMLGAAYSAPRAKRGRMSAALAFVLAVTLVDVVAAQAVSVQHGRRRGSARDYRDRSGFPRGLAQAHGAARDFCTPREYQAVPGAAEISPPTGQSAGNGSDRHTAPSG